MTILNSLKSFIFISLFVATFIGTAYADSVLFFSPTRVNLNDKDRVEVINITNLSNIARAYKIDTEDLVMIRDGILNPVENFDYSAKRMIRFVPRKFTLQPNERQAIRIMARVSGNTPDGEYHTHLRFLEDVSKRDEINAKRSGSASIAAPLAYEALIPVVLSHGTVSSNISMKDVKIKKTCKAYEYNISMTLNRSGNGQGTGYIETYYTDASGQKEATPRRTVHIYREIDERTNNYSFTLPKGMAGKKITVALYDNASEDAKPLSETQLSIP